MIHYEYFVASDLQAVSGLKCQKVLRMPLRNLKFRSVSPFIFFSHAQILYAKQAALVTKISRERVGEELDKMMKGAFQHFVLVVFIEFSPLPGRDPLLSAQLIHQLRLYSSVCAAPESVESTYSTRPASYGSAIAAMHILDTLLTSEPAPDLPPLHPLLTSQLTHDKTLKARLYLAAFLTPYSGIMSIGKGKPKTAVEMVLREALKLGVQNHYVDGIPELFASAEIISGLSLNKFPAERRRVDIGMG